jgi:hypothetical protein
MLLDRERPAPFVLAVGHGPDKVRALRNLWGTLKDSDAVPEAIDYIAESKALVPNLEMKAELEAERARRQTLEAENEALKSKRADDDATQFDEMTGTQIKDYIERESGMRPLGNPARKTLVRSATELATRARSSGSE